MSPRYRFKCNSCGQWHEGIPAWGWNYPLHYHTVPIQERERRCCLTSDTCVIDDSAFYVCGCLELPVVDSVDILSFRIWVSLSKTNFYEFQNLLEVATRSSFGPYFGWLSVPIPTYPDSMNLKTHAHLRDNGIRPLIELEPTDHPLAIEQRNGVGEARIQELYAYFENNANDGSMR
jgi:hypothetical protein